MPATPTPNHDLPSALAAAVTPHDTNALPFFTRALYVGGTGNITVSMNGVDVLFTAVPAGMILPIRTDLIKSTGTNATAIVALY